MCITAHRRTASQSDALYKLYVSINFAFLTMEDFPKNKYIINIYNELFVASNRRIDMSKKHKCERKIYC